MPHAPPAALTCAEQRPARPAGAARRPRLRSRAAPHARPDVIQTWQQFHFKGGCTDLPDAASVPPRSSGHACAPPSRAPSRRIGDPRGRGAPTDTGSPVAPPLKFPRGPEGQKPPRAPPGPRRSGTRGPLLSGGVGETGTPRARPPGELGRPRPPAPGAKLLPSPPSGKPGAAPPRARRELATFAVLWKLARRHHQEITLSCSRRPRRRPQSEAHGEPDTRDADRPRPRARGLSGGAHTHAHTHTQKEREKSWVPPAADCAAASIRTTRLRARATVPPLA